jgi:hypothetical protein
MTLITWNCQDAFLTKYPSNFAHLPDILIIQESEHTTKLTYTSNTPTQSLWYGDNPHKGISIHTFSSYTIKPHKSHNPDLKYIIPLTVIDRANIHSTYHQQYLQEQGKDAHPTFYLQRKKEKPSA